jgi:hypothetical protein
MVIHDKRLRALEDQLRLPEGECPFVVREAADQEVTLRHYDGGRDAKYVIVERRGLAPVTPACVVTVRYAPFVESTAIIYDATARAMQGKARPFACDLTEGSQRVYALLPVQIESIRLRADAERGAIRFRVAFLDASGDRVQAALPFEFKLLPANKRGSLIKDLSTDRQGEYDQAPAYNWPVAGERWQVVVRSLLTGDEATAEFVTP